MIYYDKDGKRIEYGEGDFLGKGKQGKVVRLKEDSDKVLKIYRESSENLTVFDDYERKFTEDMFKYFCDLDNPNFSKLYQLLYDKNGKTILAYTMKYYEESLENILFLPTSYLVENFNVLYQAIEKLTEDCIRVIDLNCDNLIPTDDGIVVIDFDKYTKESQIDVDILRSINRSALLYAFRGIVEKSLKTHGILMENNPNIKALLNYLFTETTSPIVLKAKLSNYDKPIDAFYRK